MICKKEVILFIIYACLQQFAANHIISHVLFEDSRKIQTGQTIPEEQTKRVVSPKMFCSKNIIQWVHFLMNFNFLGLSMATWIGNIVQ